jgi:short-subunit dehydrogenase involved in D-alanine esterification of teichoic acids
MKTTGNTILITGGGTGIGEALAHRFHDLGNVVIIAGRRMDALQKAIGERANMHALTLDMDDAANVAAFAEKQSPTPQEIVVEGVDFMRNAEAEGRLESTLAAINPFLK